MEGSYKKGVQWNLSIMATIGTSNFGRYIEVGCYHGVQSSYAYLISLIWLLSMALYGCGYGYITDLAKEHEIGAYYFGDRKVLCIGCSRFLARV